MSKHMQRLASPKKYPILKKESVYVIKMAPGPHSKDNSLPLLLILRDMLKLVKTGAEARKLLNMRKIMVDKTVRTSPKFPVGLMDTLYIPELKQAFRLLFGENGHIQLVEIDEKESGIKPCKILNKRIISKGKVQLNLHDGRNIIVADTKYKPGDTVMVSLPSQEIKKHSPLEKGATVYITDGKHIGEVAKISEFLSMKGSNPDRILLSSKDGNFETLKKYVFVIGQDKSEIKLLGE